MARNVALISTAIILLLLAGCGFDEGRDLRPIVKQTMPESSRLLGACGGSSGLIDYPSYGCTALARGDGAGTTEAMASVLRNAGFDVACPEAGSLVATRRDIRVTADVTQWGSIGRFGITSGTWRPRGSHPIPHGFVAFRINGSRLSDSSVDLYRQLIAKGGRCDRPLLKPNTILQCVIWWNAPVGRRTREAVPWRTAGPGTEVVAHNREGESACTYTIRNGRGFLRVTARFDGDWHWPPLRRVRGRATFRPNARINPGDERLEVRGT